MSNTPSDAELDALRQADNGALNFVTLREFRIIARAVLAKWGQPAHSGEPVAWLSPWRADQVTTDYDAYGEHGIPLYTAPQPSPAAQGDALDAPVDAAVQQDAERWQFFAEYLVSTRTDLDDEIVGCDSVQKMARVLDAARAAQEGKSHE